MDPSHHNKPLWYTGMLSDMYYLEDTNDETDECTFSLPRAEVSNLNGPPDGEPRYQHQHCGTTARFFDGTASAGWNLDGASRVLRSSPPKLGLQGTSSIRQAASNPPATLSTLPSSSTPNVDDRGRVLISRASSSASRTPSLKPKLSCDRCEHEFTAEYSLRRHKEDVHDESLKLWTCDTCGTFDKFRPDKMRDHARPQRHSYSEWTRLADVVPSQPTNNPAPGSLVLYRCSCKCRFRLERDLITHLASSGADHLGGSWLFVGTFQPSVAQAPSL